MPGFFFVVLCAACDTPPAEPAAGRAGIGAELSVAGHIDNQDLAEISGMARSHRHADLLWVHNDSGDKARLHAIATTGRYRGQLELDHADNRDWEDMASFLLDGEPYLLVADIGDNEARREFVTLYAVAEPDLEREANVTADPAWRIDFRYPDGPRDAEAVAVDAAERQVYIVSKRDLPPVLYRLPLGPAGLGPAGKETLVAERVTDLKTLPQPARSEMEFAPMSNDWHWQPTGMDIAPDGRFVVLLTYGAVYYFERGDAGTASALADAPLRFALRGLRNAEALAAGSSSKSLYLTVEQPFAPLMRIDLSLDAQESAP